MSFFFSVSCLVKHVNFDSGHMKTRSLRTKYFKLKTLQKFSKNIYKLHLSFQLFVFPISQSLRSFDVFNVHNRIQFSKNLASKTSYAIVKAQILVQ